MKSSHNKLTKHNGKAGKKKKHKKAIHKRDIQMAKIYAKVLNFISLELNSD